MHGQAVRVLLEGGEQILKGFRGLVALGEMAAQREACAPVLRIGIHQTLAALDEAVRDGRIRSGQHVLLEAVGGGFTWGAALIKWA